MQNCQDNQNSDVFMNINHVDPTRMPLWVQDQAVHWRTSPTPSQSPRGELEKLVGGQTEHQAWGDGIPEPEAAWQGAEQTASTLGFLCCSSRPGSELRAGWHLEAQPAALPQEISI